MKNGPAEGGDEQPGIMSRKEILDDYIKYYSHTWSEDHGKVCNDARLITKAVQFLLSEETEPRERFETLPFYQIVCEGTSEAAAARDCRRYLKGFIKAAEVLERLCVNLFLYPWKKEFKTLKTCTGAFVYSLLPVLSHSTIQSVLALIGYLPDTDTQQRTSSLQYRLSEEADPDRAMALGFELLLARLECQHILRLTEQAQQGPQDWAEILQGRARHHGGSHTEESLGLPSETTTTAGQENDQIREEEEMEEENKEEVNSSRKEPNQASQEPLSLEAKPKVKPRLRQGSAAMSSTRSVLNEDRSILEMQRNYPDLAIRGRPLLRNKTRTGSSSSNGVKAVAVETDNKGSGSKTADIASSDHANDVKAASVDSVDEADNVTGNDVTTTTTTSRSDSKASKMHSDINADGCKAGNQVASVDRKNSGKSNSNVSSSDKSRAGGDTTSSSDKSRTVGVSSESDLSGPAAISMHITLRAGATQAQTSEDKTLKSEDHRPEPLPRAVARRGDQSSGGLSSKEQPSRSSIEEEDLAQRIGHIHQGKKASRRRDGETKNEEKKRAGEKDEEDNVLALQNVRYSFEESVDEEDDGSYPGQGGPSEGNQPILCHPSAVITCNISDCHSCKEEEGTGGGGESGSGSKSPSQIHGWI